MSRSLAFIVLTVALCGCTRYGASPAGGPFGRRAKPEPVAIPPAPPANNSPLAMNTTVPANIALPPADSSVVPPRSGDGPQVAAAPSVPIAPTATGPESQPLAAQPRKPRADTQLPSPFARDNSAITPAGGIAAANVAPPVPGPSAAAVNIAAVKKLALAAQEKWARVDTYEAVVTRKELTPAREMSEDLVLYQYRKQPMSVYIRNIGHSGKGREVLYNPVQHKDKIYVIVGEGDSSFMRAGSRAPAVSPDMPMVRDKSRYSIREAGWGTPINRVASWVAKAEAGKIPADALTYVGPAARPEYPYPLTGVSLRLRPGDDPHLPGGGRREWFFDPKEDSPSHAWPVLIIATDERGREVEYYLFQKTRLQVPFTDADFSPDRLGKKQ